MSTPSAAKSRKPQSRRSSPKPAPRRLVGVATGYTCAVEGDPALQTEAERKDRCGRLHPSLLEAALCVFQWEIKHPDHKGHGRAVFVAEEQYFKHPKSKSFFAYDTRELLVDTDVEALEIWERIWDLANRLIPEHVPESGNGYDARALVAALSLWVAQLPIIEHGTEDRGFACCEYDMDSFTNPCGKFHSDLKSALICWARHGVTQTPAERNAHGRWIVWARFGEGLNIDFIQSGAESVTECMASYLDAMVPGWDPRMVMSDTEKKAHPEVCTDFERILAVLTGTAAATAKRAA